MTAVDLAGGRAAAALPPPLPDPLALPAACRDAGEAARTGAEGRRLYHRLNLYHGAKYPPLPILFYPGIRHLFLLAAIVWVMLKAGRVARRATGRPLVGQLRDLLVLGFRKNVDPVTYYLQELDRPGGLQEADYYLTRFESKNGLLYELNHLLPQPGGRSEMNDKLLFADRCHQFGLATAPILLVLQGEAVVWRADRAGLDRDLFCKFRQSSGARGTMVFHRIAPHRYRGSDGRERSLDELIAFLRPKAQAKPLLVQARLHNHPAIADLAQEALVTFRVLTCLNDRGVSEATHGILRIMKKLEPFWQVGPDDEYGAPIDLATGRLGMLTGDKLPTHAFRYSRHPMTGAVVTGRVLGQWPTIRGLAEAAHARFPHRVVIGWDIALTESGPVLLEGNTNFDVMFFQRVYRRGAGRTRLGELLAHHFTRLEASKRKAGKGGQALPVRPAPAS